MHIANAKIVEPHDLPTIGSTAFGGLLTVIGVDLSDRVPEHIENTLFFRVRYADLSEKHIDFNTTATALYAVNREKYIAFIKGE